MSEPFELKILPSCPLFRTNKVRPYVRPQTKQEAEEAKNRFWSSLLQQGSMMAQYNQNQYGPQNGQRRCQCSLFGGML